MLGASALIFVARTLNVAMATVRTLVSMRGQRALAAAAGFVESLIFLLAIREVLQGPTNWMHVLSYSGGFAAGTIVGMVVEERLALGHALLTIISSAAGQDIARTLRAEGHAVTELVGQGMKGAVGVVNIVVRRRDIPAVTKLIHGVDAQAFVVVEDANRIYRGYLKGIHAS